MLVWLVITCCVISGAQSAPGVYVEPPHVYHDHDDLMHYLSSVALAYPDITYLYSIGQSIEGRELMALALAATSPDQPVLLRPEVKYVGNMHGNEAVSRELLIHFIHHLVTGYGEDHNVTSLLESTRVHILVSMNPDGFELTYRGLRMGTCSGVYGRYNADGYDLNRNFPDYFRSNSAPIQSETQAVIDWMSTTKFTLSANLHGGALVVNYPYDNNRQGRHVYSASPDDDVFRHLSTAYSYAHTDMHTGSHCGDGFTDGITNGADWYAITGSMQDFNYIYRDCMEVTIEVSCCKYPQERALQGFWEENRHALVHFLHQAQIGVKGVITNENGEPLEGAVVSVEGRMEHSQTTTARGEYWRLLLPGNYNLQVALEHYNTEVVNVAISVGQVVERNILLTAVCTDHFLNYTNQDAYEVVVTKADNKRDVNPYAALKNHEDSPLVLELSDSKTAKMRITVGRHGLQTQQVVASQLCVKASGVKKINLEYVDSDGISLLSTSKKSRRTTCFDTRQEGVHTIKLSFKKKRTVSEIELKNLHMEACSTQVAP